MSATWMTKWGPRRVRVELPTLAEALDAAEGLASDAAGQITIAASLMDLPLDHVRADAERLLMNRARRPQTIQVGQTRGAVVVERKRPRRVLSAARG